MTSFLCHQGWAEGEKRWHTGVRALGSALSPGTAPVAAEALTKCRKAARASLYATHSAKGSTQMSPTVFPMGVKESKREERRGKEGKEIYFGGGQDEGQWVDSEGGELLVCLSSISQPLVQVTAVSFLRDPPSPVPFGFGGTADYKVLSLLSRGRTVTQTRHLGSISQSLNLDERRSGRDRRWPHPGEEVHKLSHQRGSGAGAGAQVCATPQPELRHSYP